MARDDGDRAELAHRARIAEQDAVEQRPADVRQRDLPEGGEARRTQGQGRGLLVGPLVLHQRDQLAGDKGEGHQDGRQHQARGGEDDLDVVIYQPGSKPALGAEQQHPDHAGNHRRYREWQVDQGQQKPFAAELELGDAPGRRDAEHRVQRHRDRRYQQGQPHGRQRIRITDRREILAEPFGEGVVEHHDQRHQHQQRHDDGRGQHQQEGQPWQPHLGDRERRDRHALPRRARNSCRPLIRIRLPNEIATIARPTAAAPA